MNGSPSSKNMKFIKLKIKIVLYITISIQLDLTFLRAFEYRMSQLFVCMCARILLIFDILFTDKIKS
jgi:hypothetical protein